MYPVEFFWGRSCGMLSFDVGETILPHFRVSVFVIDWSARANILLPLFPLARNWL